MPGSAGAEPVCRILGACPAFPAICFTLLTSPCYIKQAVVGSGCFAPDPNSANPWDGDHCSGWGGRQSEERALKTLWGWQEAQKCSSEKALFQAYIYDLKKKKNLKS